MADFQRDQDIVAYEGFSGIRNDVLPQRMTHADLAVAQNIDIDETGGIKRRAGRTSVYGGNVRSLWSDGAQALFVEGTNLKRLNPDYTATTLRTGLTPLQAMAYQGVNDAVYFANGRETGVVQGGLARSWGLPMGSVPGVTVTVGNMPAGDYQFTQTYFRNDGQESGAGLAGRIRIAAGSGLVFAMPISTDPGVTNKAMYLTTPNGDVLYQAGIMTNNTTSFTYQNDSSELALPLTTQFMGPPPAGHLVGYYYGRMYVAVGSDLFYSEPYAYELFDRRKYLSFDSRITMFAPVSSENSRDNAGIFLGTERSTTWLAGEGPEDFKAVAGPNYGVVMGAMDYVDGSMFTDGSSGARMLPMWMSTRGICVGLAGGMVQNVTQARYQISASGSGCALFKPDSTQFVAVANS